MANNGEVKWFDCDAKLETPKNTVTLSQRNCGEPKGFAGIGAKASAGIVVVKVEENLSENTKAKVEGPSLGGSIGAKLGSENCLAAIVEPSILKVEATHKVNDNAAVYISGGLNATTGLMIDDEKGVKFGVLGFGLTLGVGGKWGFDTPFGSVGAGNVHEMCNAEQELLN